MSHPNLRGARSTARFAVGLVAVLPTPALLAQPASFQGLGSIGANAISADGTTVVGNVRWTAASGISAFDDPAFMAHAVSADGSMIVGAVYPEAARWTKATGVAPQGAGHAAYSDFAYAYGVSADRQTMVGTAWRITNTCCWFYPGGICGEYLTSARGFVQSESGGPLDLLPPLEGYSSSVAMAVSGDASVVVGYSFDECCADSCNDALPAQACLWLDGSPLPLGSLDAQFESRALAVSSDGSTIVGYSAGRAFRWTANAGMIELTGLWPTGVSADGNVVVGRHFPSEFGFIWDPVHGTRELGAVLAGLRLDLTGWLSLSPVGVSADGRSIAG